MTKKINIHLDMETSDPDDVMTLAMLSTHPLVKLRGVTVTPGTDEQIGLVRMVLEICGHHPIPVGSFRPGYEKNCVSQFHNKWFGKIKPSKPDDMGYKIIEQSITDFSDITVVTGAPLRNFKELNEHIEIKRWVAQGGFAGDNVVPPEHRLNKFKGMTTCPTFNFNGDPKTALKMLFNPNISERRLVSKNVCHGVVYDEGFHRKMEPFKDGSKGLNIIYHGMTKYLERRPSGKMFHDPLAACTAIDPDICQFREVELFRKKGKWGSIPKEGTNTFISVWADHERFFKVLTMC